jgi:holliday junction DNA helicase RuvA
MQNIVYLRPRRLHKVGESVAVASFEEANGAVVEVREFHIPSPRMKTWELLKTIDELHWLHTRACSGYGPHLFTHCAVNANSGEESWYGFETSDELQFFRKLLTLDKVGPKSAFKVLDKTPFSDIHRILVNNDQAAFRKLPGVGPKMADAAVKLLFNREAPKSAITTTNTDAVATLQALGMTKVRATELVVSACAEHPEFSTEELVKLCLKRK